MEAKRQKPQKDLSRAGPATAASARLRRLVRDLGAPYGHERSFKICDRAVLDDRYLLSLHKSAFGAEPWSGLLRVCEAMSLPGVFVDEVKKNLPAADILHLGFERGVDSCVYKLYLEFAGRSRRDAASAAMAGTGPMLVHLAFKWDPAHRDGGTVARYTCQPTLSAAQIVARLSAIHGGRNAGAPQSFARKLLDTATARMGEGQVFFMEVEEEGNPRRSFDINLYDAALNFAEIGPMMSNIWRHFRIPQERWRQILASAGSKPLGHVSGGIGRDGEEFLSLYFGVTAH